MSAENEDTPPLVLGGGPAASTATVTKMRERRSELAEHVATLTWDLGGLAYEMAVRDHYRLDVLARKAAELQQADAELAELQRLLSTAEAGIEGQCRSCGAVHSRGASYCWHCGAPLLEQAAAVADRRRPPGLTAQTFGCSGSFAGSPNARRPVAVMRRVAAARAAPPSRSSSASSSSGSSWTW